MPRITTWIRKHNEQKWLSIKDKSDWINKHLDKTESTVSNAREGDRIEPEVDEALDFMNERSREPLIGVIKTPESAKEVIKNYKLVVCKHGFPPDMCKFAKPGKPCK